MTNQQNPKDRDYNKLNVGCFLDSRIDKMTSDTGWIREGQRTPEYLGLFIEYEKMKALDRIADQLESISYSLANKGGNIFDQ